MPLSTCPLTPSNATYHKPLIPLHIPLNVSLAMHHNKLFYDLPLHYLPFAPIIHHNNTATTRPTTHGDNMNTQAKINKVMNQDQPYSFRLGAIAAILAADKTPYQVWSPEGANHDSDGNAYDYANFQECEAAEGVFDEELDAEINEWLNSVKFH